jgi:hypothetical protein
VKKQLTAVPWHLFYRSDASIDEKCKLFYEILTNAIKHIPREEIAITHNDKPWITPLIISLINKRYAAYRMKNFVLYKHFQKKIKLEITKAKKNWSKKVNEHKNNPWTIINTFRNKKNANQLSDVINSFATTKNAANAINDSLAKHFVRSNDRLTVPTVNLEPYPKRWNVFISQDTVYNSLRKLKVGKSAGSDNLSPRLIVALADVLVGPLTHLFCLSVDSETMPSQWKLANVCPVPKKRHPTIDDLRPISILPIFSKILEKLILSSVQKQLIDMYGRFQFGFRPRSSTLHAHICFHEFITNKLENDYTEAVMVVSTDLKRAFDSLSHTELLRSLKQGNLPQSFINWCASFLSHRTQRVVLDVSTFSEITEVTSGVPQGSVLSPYLFAAHVGSLKSTNPDAKLFKYADDVVTAIPLGPLSNVDDLLCNHLEDMQLWCKANGLTLNCDKTKVLVITKKGRTILPKEKCHVNFICHEMKILGVFYNDKLNWTTHTTHVCKKARRNLYILKQLKKFTDKHCLVTSYNSLVLSILEYCGPLFLGIDASNARQLEKIRKRAHLIVCGPACECSSFEKLDVRRIKQSLKLLCSMSKSDHILHHLYPRRLTASRSFALPHCSTKRRLTSFIPQCILRSNKLL